MINDQQDKLSTELIELSIESIRKINPSLALTLRNIVLEHKDQGLEAELVKKLSDSDLEVLITSIARQGRERLEKIEQGNDLPLKEKHALNAWIKVAQMYIHSRQ